MAVRKKRGETKAQADKRYYHEQRVEAEAAHKKGKGGATYRSLQKKGYEPSAKPKAKPAAKSAPKPAAKPKPLAAATPAESGYAAMSGKGSRPKLAGGVGRALKGAADTSSAIYGAPGRLGAKMGSAIASQSSAKSKGTSGYSGLQAIKDKKGGRRATSSGS